VSNGRIHLQHLGRWGNNLFGVAFALGYARRYDMVLTMDPWIGQEIFEPLPGVTYGDTPNGFPVRSEYDLPLLVREDFTYRSYSQCQKCVDYYSRSDCKIWFKLRPEIKAKLAPSKSALVAHIRRTDYAPLGYPLVSVASYDAACEEYGLSSKRLLFVGDDHPSLTPGLPPEMDFLQDFYTLMTAKTLLRANSSFSFWAAVLSDALVLSPAIDGLDGGKEHDCRFVPGNHPRLSNHHFVTELHLAP
jgi:hypothetical protein